MAKASIQPQPAGNVKVTRDDWLRVALDALVSDGVERVKVLHLGERLGVSRSSFYWYFRSRQDLLDALLKHWDETNTKALVDHAEQPAATIAAAVLNVFRCFLDPALFDTRLDFAVREWARRSGKVRRVLDLSDAQRQAALAEMFRRHGFEELDAFTRARILYYMQIGYNAADLNEPMSERLKLAPTYILGFTGQTATDDELSAHLHMMQSIERRDSP